MEDGPVGVGDMQPSSRRGGPPRCRRLAARRKQEHQSNPPRPFNCREVELRNMQDLAFQFHESYARACLLEADAATAYFQADCPRLDFAEEVMPPEDWQEPGEIEAEAQVQGRGL